MNIILMISGGIVLVAITLRVILIFIGMILDR